MVELGYSHSQKRRVHPPHTHSQSMYPRGYTKLGLLDLVVLGLGVLDLGVLGLDMGIGYG